MDYGNPSVDYGSPSVNYGDLQPSFTETDNCNRASDMVSFLPVFFVVDAIFALQAMLIRLVDDVFSAYIR